MKFAKYWSEAFVAVDEAIFGTSRLSTWGVDPLYVKLCKAQSCFRARLTPKPWRIGLERPSSRFPHHKPSAFYSFQEWLKNYELASRNVSTVKLVATFGNAREHPDVDRVLEVHDRYARRSSVQLA